jgi:hypothetical protein
MPASGGIWEIARTHRGLLQVLSSLKNVPMRR